MLFLLDADKDVFEVVNDYIETHDDISHLTKRNHLSVDSEEKKHNYATKLKIRQFNDNDTTKEIHYELYLILTIGANMIPKIKFGWDGTIDVIDNSKEDHKIEHRTIWDVQEFANASIDKFMKTSKSSSK